MKTKYFTICCLVLIGLFFLIENTFAFNFKRGLFSWKQTYNYDFNHPIEKMYINKLSMDFNLNNGENTVLKIKPFFEVKRNTHGYFWQKERLGLEVGKDFTKWFYTGLRFSQIWAKDDWQQYGYYEKREYRDLEYNFRISYDLINNSKFRLVGFIIDEYTYDLNIGAGVRNEVVIGVSWPINKYLETSVNWRHVDRVHYFDQDTYEASVTMFF